MNIITMTITAFLAGLCCGILLMRIYHKKECLNTKEIVRRLDETVVKNMNLTDKLIKIRAELAETGNKQKAAQLDAFIGKNSACTYRPAPNQIPSERVDAFIAEQNRKFEDLQEKVERDIRYLEEKLNGKPFGYVHTPYRRQKSSHLYVYYNGRKQK